jgi:hypothetical protein
MRKLIAFVFISIVIVSCCQKQSADIKEDAPNKSEYNISIHYIQDSIDINPNGCSDSMITLDSLHLTCEFYYASSRGQIEIPDSLSMDIYKNNKFFMHEKLNHSELELLGHRYINCGRLKEFHSLGIRINKGNLAYIQMDSTKHIVRMVYDAPNKSLDIHFLRSMPYYR